MPGCPCRYGDVRLQNGSTASEGRVEVCIDCEWGTVCDNWWNDAAATVVCNQLGSKEKGKCDKLFCRVQTHFTKNNENLVTAYGLNASCIVFRIQS